VSAKTTLKYKGVDYPFYRTNRAQVNFEDSGYTTADAIQGKQKAVLSLIYFTLTDCARRAKIKFTDDFDEFIDNSDPDVIDVFERLAKAQQEENSPNVDSPGIKNLG
jgi:hypothetical protein